MTLTSMFTTIKGRISKGLYFIRFWFVWLFNPTLQSEMEETVIAANELIAKCSELIKERKQIIIAINDCLAKYDKKVTFTGRTRSGAKTTVVRIEPHRVFLRDLLAEYSRTITADVCNIRAIQTNLMGVFQEPENSRNHMFSRYSKYYFQRAAFYNELHASVIMGSGDVNKLVAIRMLIQYVAEDVCIKTGEVVNNALKEITDEKPFLAFRVGKDNNLKIDFLNP